MKMKPRLSGVCILLMLAAATCGCGKDTPDQGSEPVRPIKMMEIAQGAAGGRMEYPGTVSPFREVAMSFEVPGKLSRLNVTEGESVKKGKILARLDDKDYRLAFEAKKAVYDTALKDHKRGQALMEKQVISRKQYDDFKKAFEVADAEMKSARKKLDDSVMTAPFDGRVASRLMDNYQNVQAKQTVMVFQDDSILKLRVDVPEQDLVFAGSRGSLEEATRNISPRIRLGTYPKRSFEARFHEISTAADPVTRTFSVTLTFTPPDDIMILPGMTARLSIENKKAGRASSSDGILIPAGAVFSDTAQGPCVWRIDTGTMTAAKQPVDIGPMERDMIRVISGLKNGDSIALSGIHQLREGDRVSRFQP